LIYGAHTVCVIHLGSSPTMLFNGCHT
jgi:hypothetical protein